MRLFVAVSPPDEILDLVAGLARPELPRLRWTTRDQWHVTLRFLGEIQRPEPVAEVLQVVPGSLRAAGIDEIEAVLGPAVAWFSGRRILQVPVAGVDSLAHLVSSATARWGEPPERGPYAGHLTLARVRGPGKGPVNLAGTAIRGRWKVREIELLSSALGAGGARYETLDTVALG